MLNARGRAPRATMSLPPLVSSLSLSFSPRRSFLSPSLRLALLLSLLHFEHRYLWNLLHRAPATFRFARSYLVSSCLEEAPETRNVSISVTIDGVPSCVSSRLRTLADSTYVTRPDLQHVTEQQRHWRLSFSARLRNTAALSAASANFFNRVLPLTRANLEARRVTSNKRYRDRRKRSCNLERAPISKFICLDADKPMRRHSRVSVIYSLV